MIKPTKSIQNCSADCLVLQNRLSISEGIFNKLQEFDYLPYVLRACCKGYKASQKWLCKYKIRSLVIHAQMKEASLQKKYVTPGGVL